MAEKQPKKPTGASSNNEPTIRVTSGWTPTKVDQARRQADLGDLSLAADLWERVMGDERAIGPLQALCGIPGLPLVFESATGQADDPRVEALGDDFWEMLPDEVCGEVIRWASGLGVALLQIKDWETDPDTGRVLPVCEVWHPRCLRWDSAKRTWCVRTTASGGTYVPIEPGDGEWIIITPYGRKRPWAKAPWYSLGLLWLFTQYAKFDWGDLNDVHGKPLKSLENITPEKAGLVDDDELKELVAKVAALARGGTIALPDGYSLKLVEATSKGWESFVKLIDEVWPKAVSIALTGQNLSTQVDGGSFAAATVHANVSHDRIRTFAESLALAVRSQLLVWWCEFNFGDRRTPWAKWETKPPSDRKAEAERLSLLATAIQALTTANVPLDMVAMVEQYGLPVDLEKAKEAQPTQLYKYHFDFGIITINEARQRIGLAPISGGDKPPDPPQYGSGEELSGHGHDVDPVELSARAEDDLLEGFTLGTMSKGGEALAGDVDELIALVRDAKDEADVYKKLTETYGAKDSPAQFLERMERTLVLSAMMGRRATVKEV